INLTQLHLVALKKAAIQRLGYDDVLTFLGFREGKDRLELFQQIKNTLVADVRQYWEQHTHTLAKGVIHQGKFERYFQLFAQKVLPLIHSQRQVERLLAPKEEQAQITIYTQH